VRSRRDQCRRRQELDEKALDEVQKENKRLDEFKNSSSRALAKAAEVTAKAKDQDRDGGCVLVRGR